MIHTPDGTLRFSPRDLVSYLEGDFAAWCDRAKAEGDRSRGAGVGKLAWLTPDEEDEELKLVARKGIEHESRYLAKVKAREPNLVAIQQSDSAANETLAAMRAGVPVVYQAHLTLGDWHGYSDFLFRVPGKSRFGDYHYAPWDTKLARSAKPYFLVQLCAYAEMLEAIQGVRPAELVFVLGNDDERRFETGHYFFYYRRLKDSFLEFQKSWAVDSIPDPALDRSWGRWAGAAEKLLAESDHLSLVANITRGQIRRLEEAAITTLNALAATGVQEIPGMKPPVFERLRLQAQLQLRSSGAASPAWEFRAPSVNEPRRGLALLPPPSDGDVFFDMEGFPFAKDGLEYLFGAATPDGERSPFHDWWAHDAIEEQHALEGFIDWVAERRKRHPDLHVYHYNSYETTAVKRLMGRYGTREAEVDDLLRGDVFVDLYTVVRQGMLIGTPSYSLKDIERLYLPPRTDHVVSAGASVVEYQRWLDSGEPRDWRESPILSGIRAYNEVDCISTRGLRDWLLDRQRESGTGFIPDPNEKRDEKDEGPRPEDLLAIALVERGRAVEEIDREAGRLDRLIGWLIEYHRREEKPMWWRMFDRHGSPWETLRDDAECLAELTRTATPVRPEKRSSAYEYRFDPEQETKMHEGSKCFVAGNHDLSCSILSMDQENGIVVLKSTQPLPDLLCLIPDEFVSAGPIKEAIGRYATAWEEGEVLSQAVDDLLRRRPPRVLEHKGGALIEGKRDFMTEVIGLARLLDGTTLCIQGPPGTGKTFTAAAIIAELMRRKKRVGVTANSHKVILNLLGAVVEERARRGQSAGGIFKVGKKDEEGDEALVSTGAVTLIDSKEIAGVVQSGMLVGGTAWAFSRPDMQGALDYLFIDEAGQFSLANAVAVGTSTKNLILVGDQMQLAQPLKGTHPGESGLSCLEYFLQGVATVPPDRGVFLGTSWRMHAAVCRFVSDAIYDGRLTSEAGTARHRVFGGNGSPLVPAETGIAWVPVEHDGCDQWSEEEVEVIADIADQLRKREVVDKNGGPRKLELRDILFVAPFNMQVRALRKKLGPDARVGSVDLFQGQEAAVVIVSMCASSLEESPRGADFLLSPNRLNVAISRAEALAIVVGSPELARARCKSVEEVRLVNLLCRLIEYASAPA
ncbi:MAG: TM0106 family RecB-like putative nuclease [Gemmatimonadales bacterium]